VILRRANSKTSVGAYLDPVDEFRCRNVILVTEGVIGLEGAVSAVLELDPDEVTVFRGRSATELKGKSRGVHLKEPTCSKRVQQLF
jgi:hypothetical protein